jgi:excisionase family DNA binding protein
MPTRGTIVLPSEDTNTPDVPVPAHVLLTPDWFDIPKRRCFTPSELAPYFMTCPRTITRMIEDGSLRAVKVGAVWKIPYREIVHFFLRMQGAMN